jgi:hypothetical protein
MNNKSQKSLWKKILKKPVNGPLKFNKINENRKRLQLE